MSKVTYEYGKALYELASEEGKVNEMLSEVRHVRNILKNENELIVILSSPVIPKEERTDVVDRVFSDRFDRHLCSFMKLLTERGKAKLILQCLNEYEALWYENSGIVIAEAESAVPLTEEQKGRLLTSLEKKTGASVELKTTVVPSLIGGVRIKINGELIDGSIKGKLERIKEQLRSKTL